MIEYQPAAGMAGLIKSALALHEKMHLPSLHCETPQPSLSQTMFEVRPHATPWKAEGDEVESGRQCVRVWRD